MKKTKTSSSSEKDVPDKTLVPKLTKDNKKSKKNKKKSKNLTPLLVSLADFFERQGYSKTLAAFKSEALPDEEELDGVKEHALDMETMYFKYTEMSEGDANNNSSGKQDLNAEVVADICVDKLSNGAIPDLPVKSKEKKKKTKSTSEPIPESVEQSASAENGLLENSVTEETNVNSKDKKKRKKKSKSESLSLDAEESEKGDSKKPDSKKEKVPVPEANGAGTESKDSKKRKRGSEENESQADEKVESKDTKESKTKGSEEENVKDLSEPPFTTEKAAKKQRIGSAEPKTANAFRRVEIEKVEFVDDRLQDNSYWAKHGADVGYGAKAQEVLGQVRGKDFRHEKTKKKRGSYRGGIIDQDSHSIKFNYSDEE